MSKKVPFTITIKSTKTAEERKKINEILKATSSSFTDPIPLPYASISELVSMPCNAVPINSFYARSGIIPFTRFNNEIYLFFALFKGYDRGEKVIELSDFGGRSKDKENFITAACYETFEESLGIFNFLNHESLIHANSYLSAMKDRSVAVIATPIRLKVAPTELSVRYSEIRLSLNARFSASSSVSQNLECVSQDCNIVSLMGSSEEKESLSFPGEKRKLSADRHVFNSNEIAHIVPISLSNVILLLEGKTLLPPILDLPIHPPIYPIVARHLSNLIPYISQYRFE